MSEPGPSSIRKRSPDTEKTEMRATNVSSKYPAKNWATSAVKWILPGQFKSHGSGQNWGWYIPTAKECEELKIPPRFCRLRKSIVVEEELTKSIPVGTGRRDFRVYCRFPHPTTGGDSNRRFASNHDGDDDGDFFTDRHGRLVPYTYPPGHKRHPDPIIEPHSAGQCIELTGVYEWTIYDEEVQRWRVIYPVNYYCNIDLLSTAIWALSFGVGGKVGSAVSKALGGGKSAGVATGATVARFVAKAGSSAKFTNTLSVVSASGSQHGFFAGLFLPDGDCYWGPSKDGVPLKKELIGTSSKTHASWGNLGWRITNRRMVACPPLAHNCYWDFKNDTFEPPRPVGPTGYPSSGGSGSGPSF